ncbi:hypothetical protein DCAR_0623199 [Daucus carota subsp. sativus]|uniref:Uncharacterized protein n=1 Tax=Daucus carota subsp. sativus TaxID=79200 RepID=A0A161ZQD1_DAUCS|nr:hypothetical protein DCAR_0623199 [Daucus carota subsp. sativus]
MWYYCSTFQMGLPAGSYASKKQTNTALRNIDINTKKTRMKATPPPAFSLFDLLFFHTQKHTHISMCLGYTLAAAILLLILLGIAAAVFHFVYKPESPKYTVNSTQSPASISLHLALSHRSSTSVSARTIRTTKSESTTRRKSPYKSTTPTIVSAPEFSPSFISR